MKKNKGFTLIELIVVLVILAIIGLIVIPIVLNIIDKAKYSANKRSIDSYIKSIELAIQTYKLENGNYTYDINDLKIEYSGNKVECDKVVLNSDGSLFISKCKIDGEYVEDKSTDDGYYQYGKIIPDYTLGEVVTYNNMQFYVISESNTSLDYITLLKVKPLTMDEINKYGTGHINRYTKSSVGVAQQRGIYGGIAYYTSETCGYVNGTLVTTGCTTDYDKSDIKYVVDAWSLDKFKARDLKKDSLGYEARLLTYEDLTDNFWYAKEEQGPTSTNQGDKMKVSESWYWLMSPDKESNTIVWEVNSRGDLVNDGTVYEYFDGLVRPVVNLKKSAIEE